MLENYTECFFSLISTSPRRLECFEDFCAELNVSFLRLTESVQNLMVSLPPNDNHCFQVICEQSTSSQGCFSARDLHYLVIISDLQLRACVP